MSPEEIQILLRRQPFVPFRIHSTDERTFDVRHPEMAFLTRRAVTVGVPDRGPSAIPDGSEIIALIHIVSLEELPLSV